MIENKAENENAFVVEFKKKINKKLTEQGQSEISTMEAKKIFSFIERYRAEAMRISQRGKSE